MIYLALSEHIFEKVKEILEKHNLKYEKIEDGEQLLELAKKDPPDLIILEKDIPLLDGFSVTLILKSNIKTEEIPILVVCKADYKEEIIKAKDCGSDSIIKYPFKEEELLQKIKELLERS